MNDQSLQRLLRHADQAFGQPPQAVSTEALLAAARRRRRQTTVKRTSAAAAAITLVLATSSIFQASPTPRLPATHQPPSDWSLKRPVRSADLADLRRELARLEDEVQQRLQIVHSVTDSTDAAADPGQFSHSLNGGEFTRLETARSAALSLEYAAQVEHDFQDPAAARREYERVAERFPKTPWGNFATTSLQRLNETSATPSTL